MKTSFITIRNIILALLAFNCFNMNATLHSNIEDENDAQNASVNVIAYFCKNDTLDYVYSLEETKIKGNDTTTTLVASRKFRVVVLDSIATGYKIQCTPLELDIDEYNIEEQNFNSESEKEVFLNKIQQIINQKTYKYPIVFITNEEGAIQHIENWQNLSKSIVDATSEAIYEIVNLIPQANEFINKSMLVELIKTKYSTEEQLIENYSEGGLALLLTFHGLSFCEGETTIENNNNDEYPSSTQIAAYNFDPEEEGRDDFDPDYEVVVITNTFIEGDEIKDLLGTIMGFALKDNETTGSILQSLKGTNDFDKAKMTITDTSEYYYWFNGWPSEVIHNYIIELDAPGKPKQERYKTTTIECVYRSCFNFMNH